MTKCCIYITQLNVSRETSQIKMILINSSRFVLIIHNVEKENKHRTNIILNYFNRLLDIKKYTI